MAYIKKKKGNGGRRAGAGRKSIPIEEKKKGIWILVQNKDIQRVGGEEKVKQICGAAIKEAPAVDAGA